VKAVRVFGPGLAIGLVGLLIWGVQGSPSRTVYHLQLGKVRVINKDLGVTFAPPPPSTRPALSAAEAFSRYLGRGLTSPGNPDAVYLGLLTISSRLRPNVANNRLAYGYAWLSECHPRYFPWWQRHLILPHPCTYWAFKDANTGRTIDSVFGPGHPFATT
jgi:hypothetical protein